MGGYDRDLFADWYDADRNGCNTRKEVLIAESLDPVQIGARCAITGGRWFSIYDNVETTDSSSFDIDHNFSTRDVTVQVYDTTTYETVFTDIVRSTTNRVQVSFSVAPGIAEYRVVVTG